MWWNKRAIGLHCTLLVLLPIFSIMAYWQLSRALSGNSLSWVYTFEWPFFGFYAIFLWWKLIHEDQTDQQVGIRFSARTKPVKKDVQTEIDQEAVAYNNYLASLYKNDRTR